jgi:hypothetical protein
MSLIGSRKGRPITRMQFNAILKKFLVFLKRELNIKYDIPITLIDDIEFSKKLKCFGLNTSENIIYVSIVNRHPLDILRTVAHECVHYNQRVQGKKIQGYPGSVAENQANAKAGEIVRKYGQLHPDLFDYTSVR